MRETSQTILEEVLTTINLILIVIPTIQITELDPTSERLLISKNILIFCIKLYFFLFCPLTTFYQAIQKKSSAIVFTWDFFVHSLLFYFYSKLNLLIVKYENFCCLFFFCWSNKKRILLFFFLNVNLNYIFLK